MNDPKTQSQELYILEEELNNFIQKRKNDDRKKQKQHFKRAISVQLKERRLLTWLLLSSLMFLFIVSILSKINIIPWVIIQGSNVIIFCLLISTFIVQSFIMLKDTSNKPRARNKIINNLKITEADEVMKKLSKIHLESIKLFEINLKKEIDELEKHEANIDPYLSIGILILFIVTIHILEIDLRQTGKNITLYTGQLSLFAVVSIVFKFLSTVFEPKINKYYKEFAVILEKLKINKSY